MEAVKSVLRRAHCASTAAAPKGVPACVTVLYDQHAACHGPGITRSRAPALLRVQACSMHLLWPSLFLQLWNQTFFITVKSGELQSDTRMRFCKDRQETVE